MTTSSFPRSPSKLTTFHDELFHPTIERPLAPSFSSDFIKREKSKMHLRSSLRNLKVEHNEIIDNDDVFAENRRMSHWFSHFQSLPGRERSVSDFDEKETTKFTAVDDWRASFMDVAENGWDSGDPWTMCVTVGLSIVMAKGFWLPASTPTNNSLTLSMNGTSSTLPTTHSNIFGARLDMTFLALGMIYPISFMAYVLFKRRDDSLMLLNEYRALLLQFLTAVLNWRAPHRPPEAPCVEIEADLEDYITKATHLAYRSVLEILALNTRHEGPQSMTTHGRRLKYTYKLRRDFLLRRYTVATLRMRMVVELLKVEGALTSMDMIESYLSGLTRRAERLLLLKQYPGPLAARAFLYAYTAICLVFLSPYFSYVAGPTSSSYTSIAYSSCLAVMTVIVMDVLFHFQVAFHDFYTSRFRGDTARLAEESMDFPVRLGYVLTMARARRVARQAEMVQVDV